jgi:hypothetical protein
MPDENYQQNMEPVSFLNTIVRSKGGVEVEERVKTKTRQVA